MIKYEFMRAHGKGSEGSEKKGGMRIKKGGCTQHAHPPEYGTEPSLCRKKAISFSHSKDNIKVQCTFSVFLNVDVLNLTYSRLFVCTQILYIQQTNHRVYIQAGIVQKTKIELIIEFYCSIFFLSNLDL